MGNYNELIRKFDKIRDYMRDFYIYGFKLRNDFTNKSPRTYDNEKRRIESYMGKYMKWDYSKNGKKSFISMNCAEIATNPLYAAWKSKAFTDNDIVLHFYILSALKNNGEMSTEQLTNQVCNDSNKAFDTQTVRNKCNEYVKEGLLNCRKQGKSILYCLSPISFNKLTDIAPNIAEAVKFFQGDTILGEIGSFILDSNDITNDHFFFKHYYMSHTLEDGILLDILSAMKNLQKIEFINYNEKSGCVSTFNGVPLKFFVSAATGRRYLCVYKTENRRFFNYRLDHIKSVKTLGAYKDIEHLKAQLEKNLVNVWGVSFGGKNRMEFVSMTLYINEENEQYIIERINREGRGGKLVRLEENTFLYTVELFDSNDISPWIKTFMGRIIKLEGTNKPVINRFYNDIKKMREMYDE